MRPFWKMTRAEFDRDVFPIPKVGRRYRLLDDRMAEIVGKETVGLGCLWTLRGLGGDFKMTTQDLNMAVLGGTSPHTHRSIVWEALRRGDPVPLEVLEDHPDLLRMKAEANPREWSGREHWRKTKEEYEAELDRLGVIHPTWRDVIEEAYAVGKLTLEQAERKDPGFRAAFSWLSPDFAEEFGRDRFKEWISKPLAKLVAESKPHISTPTDIRAMQKATIEDAIAKGMRIPPRILKDYPELTGERGGTMRGRRNPARRPAESGRWVMIGGYGRLGSQNWGFDPSLVEAGKWAREARKHVGERVLLTGGGGWGSNTAMLMGVSLGKLAGKTVPKVKLKDIDPPMGGYAKGDVFEPWLGSWQISAWEKGPARSNPIERGVQICDYCGKRKEDIGFFIGASRPEDKGWTMHEGTGKISCPDCNEKGTAEGQEAIERHVRSHSRPETRAERAMRRIRGNPDDDFRKSESSKFDSLVDELFWSLSLQGGPDEELGDVEHFGWYGKMKIHPSIVEDLNRMAVDLGVDPLNRTEEDYVKSMAGVIVSEDNYGFVSMAFYESEAEFEREWKALEAEYEEFEKGAEE